MPEQVHMQVRGIDAAETDEITGLLHSEVLELDVESVERGTTDDQPDSSKGGFGQTGELVVALAGSGILPMLVQTVHDWVSRHRGSAEVTIKCRGRRLEIDGLDSEQQRAAVDAFLHSLERQT